MAFRTAGEGEPASGFQRVLAFAERGLAPYLILTFLCAVLFGLGLSSLPPTDRDEARFMQATKQMIETGDYVHIKVQDDPRTKKPIGIYWLQALSVQALGQPINKAWPYRVPSALGALLAVLMTCYAGRRLFGLRAGLVAGLAVATMPLVVAEAHLAKTDAVLLGFTTLAMAMLGTVYANRVLETKDRHDTWRLVVFWLAGGAAALIKGPVIALVVGATVATLAIMDRDRKVVLSLKPQWGIPLALLVVAPWIYLLLRGGDAGFVGNAFREDVLPKLIGGQETHGGLPGYYLVTTILTAWPWSLFIPLALVATWPARSAPAIRFCLAWLVPAWLAFEAVPTKLPHYILPLLPAAALLLGSAVQDGRRWRGAMTRIGGLGWRGLYVVVSLCLATALAWAARTYGVPMNAALMIAGASCIAIAVLTIVAGSVPPRPTVAAAGVAAALFCASVFGGVVPEASRLWVSSRLATEIARFKPTGPVVLVGFHEPSALFLLGTRSTILTMAPDAGSRLLNMPGIIVATDDTETAAVTQVVEAGGGRVVSLAKIEGVNYARGKPITLNLLKLAE